MAFDWQVYPGLHAAGLR